MSRGTLVEDGDDLHSTIDNGNENRRGEKERSSLNLTFDKFIGLKSNVSIILIKSLPKDFYAMFLPFIEFAKIIASLILWVYTFFTINIL